MADNTLTIQQLTDRFKAAAGDAGIKAALEDLPFILDAEAIQKALRLAYDRQEDTALRIMALQKTSNALSENADYIRNNMRILGDKQEPLPLRSAVFTLLKASRFAPRAFAPLLPDFMALMRELTDDPDPQLRERAAQTLAQNKDEFVQRRLLEGLQDPAKAIVPTAKAIQLLGFDIHAEHLPVVRNILQANPADDSIKIEAAHALANDPASKNLLIDLAQDKKQSAAVRMSSMVALEVGHPADFLTVVKPIILDEKEDEQVRLRGFSGLLRHRDLPSVFNDSQFHQRLSSLKASTPSPELKKLSLHYLDQAEAHHKKQ